MTIDTQHLRDLIRRAVPLPWALATSNSYRRIVRADRYEEVCSPVTMPDGHPDLWFPDGAEGPTAQLLIEASNALPDLLDIIEVLEGQVAEYARMLEKQSAEADARIEAQAAELHHIRNIPARTDQDRRMYAKGYAAARKKEQSKVDAANLVVVRAVDRCVDRDAEIAEAKSQIEHLDRQNAGLRAQHDRDSKTLREYAQARDGLRRACAALEAEKTRLRYALRWTAGALQEACRRPTIITEKDQWRIDHETHTTGAILAAADAALSGESK